MDKCDAEMKGRIFVIFFLSSILFSSICGLIFSDTVNATGDSWTTKASMPEHVWPEQAGVVNEKIYVMGSVYENGTWNYVHYVYDTITDIWTKKTPMPSPPGGQLVVHQNKIYIVNSGFLQIYDTKSDTWKIKKTIATTNSSKLIANIIADKIYILSTDTHYIYDIVEDSWNISEISILGNSSILRCTTVLDNKIYLFKKNETRIYSTESDTWSFGTAMPDYGFVSACCATTGVYAPKRIYIFGGFISIFESSDMTLIYNPENDTWSKGTPMSLNRFSPACGVINDTIYVIGGMVNIHWTTQTNEQYTPLEYIPEFPSWIILPLFLISTLTVAFYRKKIWRQTV